MGVGTPAQRAAGGIKQQRGCRAKNPTTGCEPASEGNLPAGPLFKPAFAQGSGQVSLVIPDPVADSHLCYCGLGVLAWQRCPGAGFPARRHATPGIAGILADVNTPAFTASLPATQPPTETFTPTATFTDTPSPTDTPVPTDTPTPTEPITPTDTPPQTNTETAEPSATAQPAVEASAGGVRWIDVNLSKQTLYAYEGNTIVKSFLVSTGVRQFPTVTGKYHIYVKYLYTLMHGDGYYLPNVPYTMYFYKSYGIHGTYWHHNFGHPMSHGCVNMYTPDAEWMYYWASVGTLGKYSLLMVVRFQEFPFGIWW